LEIWGGAHFRRFLVVPWSDIRSIALTSALDGAQLYNGIEIRLANASSFTVIVTGRGWTGLSAIEGSALAARVDQLERIRQDHMPERA
jgi:hypothetical protein